MTCSRFNSGIVLIKLHSSYKIRSSIIVTSSFGQVRVVHGSDGPAGRVGSGHDFAGFCRVGSELCFFLVFHTDYLLVPESIRIFEYYIRIECLSNLIYIIIK